MNITEERIKTNLLMLDYFDMWDEFHYKSIKDTKTSRYYNLITNLIDNQIEAGINWLDSEEAEQYFKEEAAYQQDVFRALEDEWDEILESKYSSVEELLDEVYRRGKLKGYSDMREHIRYAEADKLALQFVIDYNFGLIQRLNYDTRQQIKNTILSGFLAGDNPNVIAPKILSVAENRLDGSTFSPKQRATMIAKTEVSRVQNTGILQSYVNEGYTEVKILTSEDNNVCTTCLEYAYEFNKDDEITFENHGKERIHNISKLIKGGAYPPFHPLCRCTYLSVWKSKGEPPKNPLIVNLFPGESKDLMEKPKDIKFKSMSKEKIPLDLPYMLQEELLNFDQYFEKKYTNGKRGECGYLANLTQDEVSNYIYSKNENSINFNEIRLDIFEKDELIATHSHSSKSPFNYEDINTFFISSKVYMRYLIVHTPEDIFIGEFNENAYKYKNEIIQAAENDYYNMIERNLKLRSSELEAEILWNNYLKNETLNKYISFRRISK